MRWRTAHARHRRAERRLVEFQKAMDLYLMMVTYALLDEVVGGFLRRLVGEVAAMQDFMGLPAGGVRSTANMSCRRGTRWRSGRARGLAPTLEARLSGHVAAAHKPAAARRNVTRTKRESAKTHGIKCQDGNAGTR
jgi:hypothetical protein